MRHHCPNPGLILFVSLGGLFLGSRSSTQGAAETPAPSVTAVAQGAVAISTPPELHPSVRAVGVHNWKGEQRNINVIYAQRGDEIWVDVRNFDGWVNSLGEKKPLN